MRAPYIFRPSFVIFLAGCLFAGFGVLVLATRLQVDFRDATYASRSTAELVAGTSICILSILGGVTACLYWRNATTVIGKDGISGNNLFGRTVFRIPWSGVDQIRADEDSEGSVRYYVLVGKRKFELSGKDAFEEIRNRLILAGVHPDLRPGAS